MMAIYLISVSIDTLSCWLRVVNVCLCFIHPSHKKETRLFEDKFDSKPSKTKQVSFFHVDIVSGEQVALHKP